MAPSALTTLQKRGLGIIPFFLKLLFWFQWSLILSFLPFQTLLALLPSLHSKHRVAHGSVLTFFTLILAFIHFQCFYNITSACIFSNLPLWCLHSDKFSDMMDISTTVISHWFLKLNTFKTESITFSFSWPLLFLWDHHAYGAQAWNLQVAFDSQLPIVSNSTSFA